MNWLRKSVGFGVCLILTSFFIFHSNVEAHTGLYLPQIKTNNEYAVENMLGHFITPRTIKVAVSNAPQTYSVGDKLLFEATGLMLNAEDKTSTYQWDFGDNSPLQLGRTIHHTYLDRGTYYIELKKKVAGSVDFELVDILKINIVPSPAYKIPQAIMFVDGKEVIDKYINTVTVNKEEISLEASQSKGTVKEYQWEFGDGQIFRGSKITYTHKTQGNSATVILHIIDDNNIVSDEYTYIVFVPAAGSQNTNSTSSIISNSNSTTFFDSINIFLLFFRKPVAYIPIISIILVLGILALSSIFNSSSSADTQSSLRNFFQVLTPYSRRIIYVSAVVWACYLYAFAAFSIPSPMYALSSLMRYFGLTALILLFFVLTPGLLRVYFPKLPFNGFLITARKSLGISLFFFAFLHATIGFFHNLSGSLISILFLSSRYQLAIICSSIAFLIFSIMAITSIDKIAGLLGHTRWKIIHRFIYLAGILVLFHAFLIGSHFTDPYSALSLSINFFALTFILLEIVATAKEFKKRRTFSNIYSSIAFYSTISLIGIIGIFFSFSVLYTGPYDPHAKHRTYYNQLYEVRMQSDPQEITPSTPINFSLKVYDKKTNTLNQKFNIIQEKLMHIIVTSGDLTYYDHIHPVYEGNGTFTVSTQFPREGVYNLYVEYSPGELLENVSTITLRTKNATAVESAHLQAELLNKTFANQYSVTLEPSRTITVNEPIDLSYSFVDSKTGKVIDTLEPYLGAFGHLAIISEDSKIFTHVHPIDIPKNPSDKGGPKVRFSTVFQKPGKYKLFAQFKESGKVFVTDFVINIP